MAVPAVAQDVAQNTSQQAGGATAALPDGRLRVTLSVDGDGRPHYVVTRDGKSLINPSRLSFMLIDAAKLERGFKTDSQTMTASTAQIYRDGPRADYRTAKRHSIRIESKAVAPTTRSYCRWGRGAVRRSASSHGNSLRQSSYVA